MKKTAIELEKDELVYNLNGVKKYTTDLYNHYIYELKQNDLVSLLSKINDPSTEEYDEQCIINIYNCDKKIGSIYLT